MSERRKQIENIVGHIAAHYRNVTIEAITIKLISKAIDDAEIEIDVLKAAAPVLLQEQEFFPSVATLIKTCGRVYDTADPTCTAEEEWGWVLSKIGCLSAPSDWQEHPIACDAIGNMGGWKWLGMGNTADRPWRRKEFIRLFETVQDRWETEKKLTGSSRELLKQLAERNRRAEITGERANRNMESIGEIPILKMLAERGKQEEERP